MSQKFKFTGVYGQNIDNSSLFKSGFTNVIKDLDKGLNVTLMVYGITGSGKTYTMFGKEDQYLEESTTYRTSQFDSLGSFRDNKIQE